MSYSPLRFRLFGDSVRVVAHNKHSTNCRAARAVELGQADNPWVMGGYVWRDRNAGLRGFTTRWLVAQCEDTSYCSAEIFVNHDDLVRTLNGQLGRAMQG